MWNCELFVIFRTYLSARAQLGKTPSSRHGKPGRTHWSRSGRDPCTPERVAGAQTFFPPGVYKTISLVSRQALPCTYVPLKCCNILVLSLLIVVRRYVPVPYYFHLNTPQATDNTAAEQTVCCPQLPATLRSCRPATAGTHVRVSQVHMRVVLRCAAVASWFYLPVRLGSITPQQHTTTSLSLTPCAIV